MCCNAFFIECIITVSGLSFDLLVGSLVSCPEASRLSKEPFHNLFPLHIIIRVIFKFIMALSIGIRSNNRNPIVCEPVAGYPWHFIIKPGPAFISRVLACLHLSPAAARLLTMQLISSLSPTGHGGL